MQFITRRGSRTRYCYWYIFHRFIVHAYYAPSYTLRVAAAVRNRYEPSDVILKVKLGLADDITGNGRQRARGAGGVVDAHITSGVAYHTQTAMGLSPPQRITVMMRVRPSRVKLLPARLGDAANVRDYTGTPVERDREREHDKKYGIVKLTRFPRCSATAVRRRRRYGGTFKWPIATDEKVGSAISNRN